METCGGGGESSNVGGRVAHREALGGKGRERNEKQNARVCRVLSW